MKACAPGSFGAQLKTLREAAGFTQEELATIAGLSVHAVSALERGERRRPYPETVRSLSAALDLSGARRDGLLASARGSVQVAAADKSSSAGLPLTLTRLIGRETEMRTLRQWLADPAARLITLVGPGGVGKTRLAIELAQAVAQEATSRAVFVSLASIRESAFVAAAIGEALGLADGAATDLARRARAACGGQPTLLIVDNFEQVLDAAPLIAELLTSIAPLRIVATSRAPLRIRGERECAIGPLALDPDADAMSPADLVQAPAVRLFVERARDVRPDFRLTTANRGAVTAICRRLDALPLALELAAPWIKVLTLEDLLHRLVNNLLPSPAGPRDLPERQQTMTAAVGWSYRLLDPNEQRVFRRLGALPGPFSVRAAFAVTAGGEGAAVNMDDVVRALAGLIDKSLLARTEASVTSQPMYEMLETVRAYATLELDTSKERHDALQGLVQYCLEEAVLAGEGLVGPDQGEWLDRVRDDLQNYRRALRVLIAGGRIREACDIVWHVHFFWVIRGYAAEGVRWSDEILALQPPADAESRLLTGVGALLYTQGELARARATLEHAIALARGVDDRSVAAHGELVLGHVEHAAGNVHRARALFVRSVSTFEALGVPWAAGNALSGLAAVALALGDATEAERLLERSTSMLRVCGPWFIALALNVRANMAVRHGRSDEAIVLVRESLIRVCQIHDKFAFLYALVPLARAAVLKADDAWVARILGMRHAGDRTDRRGGGRQLDARTARDPRAGRARSSRPHRMVARLCRGSCRLHRLAPQRRRQRVFLRRSAIASRRARSSGYLTHTTRLEFQDPCSG
jgi:predicted ATPase/DNA-binding XRE family transcriptional regulator